MPFPLFYTVLQPGELYYKLGQFVTFSFCKTDLEYGEQHVYQQIATPIYKCHYSTPVYVFQNCRRVFAHKREWERQDTQNEGL